MKQFSLSKKDRIVKLLLTKSFSAKKPSVILREIRELADSRLDESFLMELWMRSLPRNLSVLAEMKKGSPLDEAAAMADDLFSRQEDIAFSGVDTSAMQNEIAELQAAF